MPNLRADIDTLLEQPTALGTYARYVRRPPFRMTQS